MSKTPKKRYLSVMSFVLLAVIVIYGVSKSSLGTNEINIANNEGDLWSKVANLFTVSTDKKIIEAFLYTPFNPLERYKTPPKKIVNPLLLILTSLISFCIGLFIPYLN